jgi:uncharacterized protein
MLSEPLSIESVTISIADLPNALQGIQLIQLSDFHYDGFLLSESLLNQTIAASNQLNPDIVLLTGDYVTQSPKPIHALAAKLRQLKSRVGIYAVLGNHDLYFPHSRTEITEAFTCSGIHVLWNQIAYPFGEALALVGLADFWSWEFNPHPILETISEEIPRIVLSHNPDSAEVLACFRVDLQLSGHTHGGQINLPGLGPVPSWIYASRHRIPRSLWRWIPFLQAKWPKVVKHWEWAQGLHQVGNNQLYINRGLGSFPPGRLLCPPELTVFKLVRKEPGQF